MNGIAEVRDWLAKAPSIAALTGAGISAESGIPTFRGPGGLWRNFRPEELATPAAFSRDPKLVWEWYDWRRARIAEASPNAGHAALAEFERRVSNFVLITQNVDNLHDAAGSRRVLKLHGSIWIVRCAQCGRETRDHRTPLPELPPRCVCGGLLRPGVVWFGEALPPDVWSEAEHAARNTDVFLVIGTSAVVYPAAGLAHIARAAGARVVEVNTQETALSGVADAVLQGSAAEILPLLL